MALVALRTLPRHCLLRSAALRTGCHLFREGPRSQPPLHHCASRSCGKLRNAWREGKGCGYHSRGAQGRAAAHDHQVAGTHAILTLRIGKDLPKAYALLGYQNSGMDLSGWANDAFGLCRFRQAGCPVFLYSERLDRTLRRSSTRLGGRFSLGSNAERCGENRHPISSSSFCRIACLKLSKPN
jgi:hypothetical protein